MIQLDFPDHERPALRGRLNQGKSIITTRVDADRGQCRPGMIVKTPFGPMRVIQVTYVPCLAQHPFLKELTTEQIRQCIGQPMDVIELALM